MAARGYEFYLRVLEVSLCNWPTMLETMVTPISSHVKDKNGIFTAHDEDMIF